MSMEALGRLFNVVPFAEGVWVNLRDAAVVTWIGSLAGAAGDTYTIQEARDSSGTGAQNLVAVSKYYTAAGVGATAWVEQTQTKAATVVTAAAAAQNSVAFAVRGEQLSDGFSYVKVTSTGAGLSTAIVSDLKVQRNPANLPALAT